VILAVGKEVSIQNSAGFTTYTIGKDIILGLHVTEGDLIMTGRGTSVEIRLDPSGSLLKIAENTTLRLKNLGSTGTDIEVVYGRIRAKVSAIMGQDTFRIQGQSAVAAVRGTDLGYDVLVQPEISAEPIASVFCFEGLVAVSALLDANDSPVELEANQTLVVLNSRTLVAADSLPGKRIDGGTLVFLVDNSIPEIISDFWELSPFNKNPDLKLANPEPEIVPEPQKPVAETPQVQVPLAKEPDPGNAADQFAPLLAFSALDVLPKKQYVYGTDDLKTAGIITVASGLVVSIISAVVGTYGQEIFQISQSDAASTGTVGIVSGLSITGIGTFLYLFGIIDH
jgi:hypothetical protein